jgi:uncharacterized OsmC-like protein
MIGRMTSDELRALQAPLKARYKEDPAAALVTLRARARLDADTITCRIDVARAPVVAGLHPATGGDGSMVCSGDLLLEALAACAGVTLKAVSTAMGLALRGGTVTAEGDIDFRGTLGVAKDAPVGFVRIRLRFELDTGEPGEKVDKLVQLTERYCIVYQTLRASVPIEVSHGRAS